MYQLRGKFKSSFSSRYGCAGGDRECGSNALGLRLAGSNDWLTAADPDIHCARDNSAYSRFIDDTQIAVVQSELHDFGGSGIEVDVLESSEGANGSAIDAGMREIQLHYFVAR